MAMTYQLVSAKLVEILVDSLGVDEEEVVPTASLWLDLGAESIDYLDIGFRIEKSFGIKIPKGDLMLKVEWDIFATKSGNVQTPVPAELRSACITLQGLNEIQHLFPDSNLEGDVEEGDMLCDVQDSIFTVAYLERYICRKLNVAVPYNRSAGAFDGV